MENTQEELKHQEIIRQAEAAIRAAEESIEASDQALRDMGLDPEKFREMLATQTLTPEQQEEAEALFRQDMEEIEAAVQQESSHARQRSTPSSTSAIGRMHRMV